MITRGLFVIGLALSAAACGSSPPALFRPSGNNSGSGTLRGSVVSYGDRTAIGGATVLFAGSTSLTDSAGLFTLTNMPASGGGVLTVNAAGHVFRGAAVSLSPSQTAVNVDVIRDGPPFSLIFYRMFARNGYEQLVLQPTNPWTRPPSFYFRTIVDGTTTRVSDEVVDRMKDLFARSVPELSGGRFQVAAFETGEVERPPQEGWVNVTFYTQLGGAFGRSTVGGNMGTISIRHGMVSSGTTNPNNCFTPEISVADHEITHTMGFWHTDDVLVDTFSGIGCPGAPRPAHTRYHAAIVYSRPPRNRDPDVDPDPTAPSLAPEAGSRLVVSCFESMVRR